ncbi:hypothetical protein [Ktedonospora formicarum]|uniref:Uncharacterized protein n=1 Tax=Ktedonospora formicarum TaxID=2778364 RepID=A0A8J3MT93_9CHLR|nr:hypothetical protein [Ktedonospora formicarum]GHO47982.1 hypothetical protein KSX_61450 [Ktedonospora formicarum]
MAERVASVEAEFYAAFGNILGDEAVTESLDLLRRLVEGRPAGEALNRRMQAPLPEKS